MDLAFFEDNQESKKAVFNSINSEANSLSFTVKYNQTWQIFLLNSSERIKKSSRLSVLNQCTMFVTSYDISRVSKCLRRHDDEFVNLTVGDKLQ